MLKKILLTVVTIVALGQSLYAVDDYYKYGEWNPGGHGVSDVGGFVDNYTPPLLGGLPGDEYIIFRENNTAYIYKVDVAGDSNTHPDNPNNTGVIAPRIFTYIAEFPITVDYATGGEFYIDDTGIYYGSVSGIKKWDFNFVPQPDVATVGLGQTLARNADTGEWWSATSNRRVYKYNNATGAWDYQFTYPSLAGSHHDGMEIITDPVAHNSQLFISDMTSDKIIVYEINGITGVVDDPTSYNTYSYTSAPDVEGMGYGPNNHFWMASGWGGTVYEIGDGGIRPTCSQTYHYGTEWTMYRSNCDDITVPGYDDTIMVGLVGGQLQYATADVGAIAWLQSHGHTVVPQLTLSSGQAFFTLGKYNTIDKTVGNGEVTSRFVNFKNGEYEFIGFSLPVDLYAKFGTQPVNAVYYYSGGWHTWTPADGSHIVPAGIGLYVLPNGDFGITVN
jgi:hypothetical protein